MQATSERKAETKPMNPLKMFVAGGTGNTGVATIEHLLKAYPQVTICAGVRNMEKATKLFPKVDSSRLSFAQYDVKGSCITGDKTKDAAVLRGFDTLVIIPPQGFENRVGMCTAYIEGAKTAGVKHIVLISAPAARKPELAMGKEFGSIEQMLRDCGIPCTILHAVFFFENQMMNAPTIKSDRAFYYPCKNDAPIPLIGVKDIGEAAANVAVQGPKMHGNKTYPIAADVRSWDGFAAVYSKVLGKPVKFVPVTDEQAVQTMTKMGWPEALAKAANELMHDFERNGSSFSNRELTQLLGHAPESFEQWLLPRVDAFKA